MVLAEGQTAFQRVMVLGSGFSKSFCPSLPTLKDLDNRIFQPLGPEFSVLEQYCHEFAGVCNHQSEYLKVEDIATAILGTQVFAGEEERLRHETLKFQLLRFIQRSMHQHHSLEPQAAQTLSRFLEQCSGGPTDAQHTLLISFNYDLLPEEQLRLCPSLQNMVIDYGMNLQGADSLGIPSLPNSYQRLHLLKLHGSLNWYRLKGATLQYDLRSACLVNAQDPAFPLFQHDNPIFIPMAHAKESYLRGSLFSLLWAKASHYLTLAKEIHFIGYGFPHTDINNMAFLLRHRERIRHVVVYEPDDPQELDRLQRLLGAQKVVNTDAQDWIQQTLLSY